MEFVEYPKWVYPVGVQENYAPGKEPVLVQDALGELAVLAIDATPDAAPDAAPDTPPDAAPEVTARRRGRPPKDAA
jgi:hypothetical protein